MELNAIINSLKTCNTIYNMYKDILNSYLVDFYVEEHWDKMPNSWKKFLSNLDMKDIGDLLEIFKFSQGKIYPLSLLCLRTLLASHTVSRKKVDIFILHEIREDSNFMKFFSKNVKLKKRHEITAMAKLCYKTALKTNCFNVVDVGSGFGHLSRLLSYKYGFKVVTFEANSALSKLATEMDCNFEKALLSKHVVHRSPVKTVHINRRIEFDVAVEEFFASVKKAFKIKNLKFGIVGLHPCGNLGTTLMRLYKECSSAVFMNIVGCCYMKLTFGASFGGFPLSLHCKNNNFKLSYLSCEIACHAIENYIQRLQTKDFCTLKIHAFRSALEKMLVTNYPELKHSAVAGVKYTDNLSLKKYCEKAKKNIHFSGKDIFVHENLINSTWNKVVAFYSMRLMLAPLVESIILYDRLLYLKEINSDCEILPAFDPIISPRNHVLVATKLDKD